MTTSAEIPASHLDILEKPNLYPIVTTMRADGHMSSTPMSIIWDGKTLRLSTLKQRMKYKNLLVDPRIALCIMDPDNPVRYIEIRGHATVEDDIDRSFVNKIAKKYIGVDVYPFDKPTAQRVIITVIPEQVSTPAITPPKAR